jgi:hypothetical protein
VVPTWGKIEHIQESLKWLVTALNISNPVDGHMLFQDECAKMAIVLAIMGCISMGH